MSEEGKDVRCRVGKHHYAAVPDDNPEKRGGSHLECTRCGHVKDTNDPPSPGLGAIGMVGGG